MASPSEESIKSVGKLIRWKRYAPRPKEVEGTCICVRPTGSSITNDEGEFHGVQFLIEDSLGKKHWTDTFADPGLPVDRSQSDNGDA